jgi:hypothetical protein
VALAASPFTAPFSTCDLTVLLGRTAGVQMAPVAQSGSHVLTATLENSDSSSDAYSISPLVTRTELGRKMTFKAAPLSCASGCIATGAVLDANQSRCGLSTQAAVLRL